MSRLACSKFTLLLMAQLTVEQILTATSQAAVAASEAAQALKDFAASSQASDSGRQRFNEASKVIRPPDAFGSENRDEDQKQWRDFILNFKSWLYYADSRYESELTYVESNPKTPILLSSMTPEQKETCIAVV